jgi:hypothetical protein
VPRRFSFRRTTGVKGGDRFDRGSRFCDRCLELPADSDGPGLLPLRDEGVIASRPLAADRLPSLSRRVGSQSRWASAATSLVIFDYIENMNKMVQH